MLNAATRKNYANPAHRISLLTLYVSITGLTSLCVHAETHSGSISVPAVSIPRTGLNQSNTSIGRALRGTPENASRTNQRDNPIAHPIASTPVSLIRHPRYQTIKQLKTKSAISLLKNQDHSPATEIEMFAGESRVFPAPGVARIAVGNGQIINANALDKKEVLVFATAVGTSSLFVWNRNGHYQQIKINVVPGETSRLAREVASFLSTIPNTKVSIIGDKVMVEGDHLNDLDLGKIEELAKRYPQIVNFTNRLGWEQMVLLDVKVVEFPSRELKELGLKWNSSGGAAIGGIWSPARRGTDGPYQINVQSTTPPPIVNPSDASSGVPLPSGLNILSAINMGLNAQLSLLSQEGKAAILAEPQLSARNGAKASFLAGGEYPYTVSTVNGTTVIFKPYGIKLDIQPRVDPSGVVRATIESEVSTIDTTMSTIAGPGLRSRKTNTEFNVKAGETIVLSGLLSRENRNDLDKAPVIGDIPVLGSLFRSKRYQNDETELVVFVTPTVINSHTPELVERIQKTTERLEQQTPNKTAFLPPIQSSPLSTPPKPEDKKVSTQTIDKEKVAITANTPTISPINHPKEQNLAEKENISTVSKIEPTKTKAPLAVKKLATTTKSKKNTKQKAVVAKINPIDSIPNTLLSEPSKQEAHPYDVLLNEEKPLPQPQADMSSFLSEQGN